MIAAVDWTNVIDTAIVTIPAIIAAILAGKIHRQIKTPSGDPIGKVIERTHELAAVGVATVSKVAQANGVQADEPPNQQSVSGG
jgi:hypothetical protein